MDWRTMEMVIEAAEEAGCRSFDLTGGSPELNRHFRRFVTELRRRGSSVQVRTNLTVLLEPEMADMPEFYRDQRVHLVGSLPCYLERNVRAQRGAGTYEASVAAIRKLNAVGYGEHPELMLDLVYNPVGPSLPPDQKNLQADYRRELNRRFGIVFSNLLTLTNMPIGRFQHVLLRQGRDAEYRALLRDAFNPSTVPMLMCRHQISIDWDGRLYDCDFNLALGMATDHGAPSHIRRFDAERLVPRRVTTGDHCFGCTAGSGSSCGGALS
jgi:radical SAM/Cys-rich protein